MSRRTMLVIVCLSCVVVGAATGQEPGPADLRDFDWDNPENLTRHPYWDFDADISPDGSRIAFHSNRPPSPGNRGQIYVANADGTEQRALTHTEGTNYMARWSPDGTRIAFVSERDGDPEIYVMNADGSDQTNLTNRPGAYDAGPDWSPDGRSIAYFTGPDRPADGATYQPPGSPSRYWNADLFVMDVASGESVQITFSDTDDIYPTWSNDGTRLSFSSVRDGNEEIYVIGADGQGLRRLTYSEVNDKAPSWLPGDRYLQFRNNAGEGEGDRSNIYMLEVATGEVVQITESPGVIYFAGSLAPDGQTYVYSAFVQDPDGFRGERADLYRVYRRGLSHWRDANGENRMRPPDSSLSR